jgi:hypothetical protein
MKVGKDKLKMSSGEVRKFKSESARDNFERVAQAVKHGWHPDHAKIPGKYKGGK